jgi:Zinc carboxypeptidase
MPDAAQSRYTTPFEAGNQNQTTTLAQCVAFYQRLANDFPTVLQLFQIGVSDGGVPIHAGVVTADGVFEREQLKHAGRPVFFNNNGIHPGEPEGIDACMALVRDFCIDPGRRARLHDTVFLFIAAYNVDGCLNRGDTSRVNQVGPQAFGFRANTRNMDLNRDFIKCDTLEAQAFNRFFCAWDPEVMVDTHTSNGADYAYTMTLIHTQSDKLGAGLGEFLRDSMLPDIYAQMEARGWPTCPYVHPVIESPDQGVEHMLDSARFSTGYAALHQTIGFMPETHMLKPFADRYAATRSLVETVLQFSIDNGKRIQALRQKARNDGQRAERWPVLWRIDYERPSTFRFKGFKAVHRPSTLGHYLRLTYDCSQPWEEDIAVYQRCAVVATVAAPRAYLIPQAWREVAERLFWNGVQLERVTQDEELPARVYHVDAVTSRATPYEGRMFHDSVTLSTLQTVVQARTGDYLVALDQPRARYAVETLEPLAHDSFFRWGFFNSILEKKERFSAYLFEDTATDMLSSEPELQRLFDQWKADHPQLLSDQGAVLDFLFAHGRRYREPSWLRYPVAALI